MLDKKTALVTGSTSGIGLGIAHALAENGAHIILNGFGDEQVIEKERGAIEKKYGVQAVYDNADMSDPSQISAMCDRAIAEFGAIDILVNNAGIQFVSKIEEFPNEKWDQILAINLSSAFHTSKALIPAMKEKGWGRIINIASAHGLVASPYKSAYVSAKHGMLGLTKTVALEVAQNGITCNAICPGYVKTPLVEGQIADQAKAHEMSEEDVVQKIMLEPHPTKKFVEVNEIGAFTVFLCSEEAQGITGAHLSIDGGWTAR
jgi:3-hydroxybutyrate dehydrogenase